MPLIFKLLLVAIWVLLALCLTLTAAIVVYRAAAHFLQSRLQRRRALYQQAVNGLLDGRPVQASELWLRRRGDAIVLEEMLVQLLSFIRGPLQEGITRAAEDAGLVDLRLQALSQRAPHRRAEAMERLGLLRSKKAVPALIERLAVEPPAIRLVAIRALGRIHAPEALEALLDELEGADEAALRVLNQALAGYGAECVPALMKRLDRPGVSSGSPGTPVPEVIGAESPDRRVKASKPSGEQGNGTDKG